MCNTPCLSPGRRKEPTTRPQRVDECSTSRRILSWNVEHLNIISGACGPQHVVFLPSKHVLRLLLIPQGKPPDEVYQEAKWSTPTKHHSYVLEDQHATPSDSNLSTPGSAQAAWPNNMGMNYQTRSAFTDASMHTQAGSVSNQPSVSAKSGSPSKLTVNGEEASERLYQESFLLRARREERLFQQLLEEDRQRRFTAIIQCVSPRVYNPPDPPSPRHLPTGMEECTFHPR